MEKALLVALWFAPYATRAVALPLGLNLMPIASALLLWLVWTRGANRSREPDRNGSSQLVVNAGTAP